MISLALHGGTPVRETLLPYAHQSVSEEDIAVVGAVLRSDWWTTGPVVQEFERAFAAFTGAKEAVAVSNGTAALHTALYGAGIGPGDEVIVPPMTFAASANAAVFLGAKPVFADCDPQTLLLDPAQVEQHITERTKAIVAVDYAGQPCDYDALRAIARHHELPIIADACHALGATDCGRPVGSLADMSTFSFHPVKPLATGEGGMVTTDDSEVAARMRRFRNHCLTTDHRERQEGGAWFYEVMDLGYNYRLTDIQCALGLSQLKRVPERTKRRQEIARKYDVVLSDMAGARPLAVRPGATHAYHLYVVQLELEHLAADREEIFRALRAENIGVNVHYIPVHLHPYYRKTFGTREGLCSVAERAYECIMSLPIFAAMNDQDVEDVIEALKKVLPYYAKR